MEASDLVNIILGSSVIATLLSIPITFYVNKRLRKIDYKLEYFKKVIDKRFKVYELIEKQIENLKISIIDESDGKTYHRIFSFDDQFFIQQTEPLNSIIGNSIWINHNTKEKVMKLSHLLSQIAFEKDNTMIEKGKKHYWEIANLREEIEILVSKDLLTLYDFDKLKISKSKGFQVIRTYAKQENEL